MKGSAVSNLPRQTTALIGREQQIDELRHLLQKSDCRLLTLVGPGGIGKTRLAIAVAAAIPTVWGELPVVYVPLQAVSSTELLPSAIADAGGIVLSGHEPLDVQLLNHLRSKQMLLVLDNFEHLLTGADLLGQIVQEAPALKLLLTSRQALSLREEWLYPVPGLPVPAQGEKGDPTAYGAVQLFGERARQVRHDFRQEDEIEAVVSICRQVEGMPLAIELAASWLAVLDCAAIAGRLRHNLDILTTPLRNLPERHQSIHAAFDGSWQMLETEEQNAFMQLSIFQGGFTLQAATEVAGAALPILSALVAKTLVRREADGRYQIHELLRQYGAEKLAEAPEIEAAAQRAHSAYFMQFLADHHLLFRDSRQLQAAQEIDAELENVRKAWQWAVDHLQVESIHKAGSALHSVCQFQSRYLEGADLFLQASRRLETDRMTVERGAALTDTLGHYGWLCIRLGRLAEADRALARACHLHDELRIRPAPDLRGYPFLPTMFLALARGEYEQATMLGEQIVRVAEEHGQPAAGIVLHYGMASAALAQNDYARAKRHAQKSLALAASVGDQRGTNFANGILGQVALAEGNLQTAKRHFEAAYLICEEFSEPGCMAEHLANLAEIALLQQEWSEAIGLFRRSHRLYQEIGDRGGIARTQLGMGMIAQKRDEPDAARRHYRLALAVAVEAQVTPVILSVLAAVGDLLLSNGDTEVLGLRALSAVLQHPSCDAQIRRRVLDSLARYRLPTQKLDSISEDLEELVAALQGELAAPPEDHVQIGSLAEPLTAREGDVLRLLADGRSNPEIAKELVVALGTVKAHAHSIYGKLGVNNRTQAVRRARELGLLA